MHFLLLILKHLLVSHYSSGLLSIGLDCPSVQIKCHFYIFGLVTFHADYGKKDFQLAQGLSTKKVLTLSVVLNCHEGSFHVLQGKISVMRGSISRLLCSYESQLLH